MENEFKGIEKLDQVEFQTSVGGISTYLDYGKMMVGLGFWDERKTIKIIALASQVGIQILVLEEMTYRV